MSHPTSKIVYNPELDQLGEVIPLYARYESNQLANLEGYAVFLSDDTPIAYAVCVSEEETGCFIVSARFVEKKLKEGTIIDLGEK